MKTLFGILSNGTLILAVKSWVQWIGRRCRLPLETGAIISGHQLITDVSTPACLLKDKPITWEKLLRVKPCKQVHVWVTRSRGWHSCMWLRALLLYYPLFTDKGTTSQRQCWKTSEFLWVACVIDSSFSWYHFFKTVDLQLAGENNSLKSAISPNSRIIFVLVGFRKTANIHSLQFPCSTSYWSL